MVMQIEDAVKSQAKLRLALVGPAGSGKTKSALYLAQGLGGQNAKIGIIDTERRSSSLYAKLFKFKVINLIPPYTVAKYREAIATFEDAEFDIIIVDSLSHAWAGEGGLLEKQGQLEASGKYKNSFATWRDITPDHNRLVDEILNSPCHMIVTMRVKTEYVLETNDRGKQVPRKVGLSPIQRDGLDFEMTVVMDVDDSHYAKASKDRTDLFDGWRDQISPKVGEMLRQWLDDGEEVVTPPVKSKDDELLERIEKALADAPDAEKVARIRNHHEAQHLAERLVGERLSRLQAAIETAVERTAPAVETSTEPAATTEPVIENYEWPGEPAEAA